MMGGDEGEVSNRDATRDREERGRDDDGGGGGGGGTGRRGGGGKRDKTEKAEERLALATEGVFEAPFRALTYQVSGV